jgi:hypothetical protein
MDVTYRKMSRAAATARVPYTGLLSVRPTMTNDS